MSPVIYLMFGLMAIVAIGGWILITTIRRADDGYEDTFGFHLGAIPSPKIAAPAYASVFATATGMNANAAPLSATVANLQPTSAPVTTTIKSPDPVSSPLYRRHRRSNNSRPPLPVASASPFEIQCAATRQRASQADSTPPLDVSINSILGQKTPSPKA